MITLLGVPGSPYTRKMTGLLRYRRLAYAMHHVGSAPENLPKAKVRLLPTFYFDVGADEPEVMLDSTPIIRRLEADHAQRSAVPANPVMRFLDYLFEDYADEWLTKAMFHYRWTNPEDIAKAGAIIPFWQHQNMSDQEAKERATAFANHQISRLGVVGSNDTTGPVIVDSFERFATLLDAHLTDHSFVFGARPSATDFALMGQLSCLALFDPTSQNWVVENTPRIHAWTSMVEDLSGLEPRAEDWIASDAIPETLIALLTEIGRTYVPVMLANARAVVQGLDTVEAVVDDAKWEQTPFPYQAKCVGWIREEFNQLQAKDRDLVRAILGPTGVLPLLG